MTLKDLMAADVSSVILNTDEFAESVAHWPSDVSGNAVNRTVVFMEVSEHQEVRDRGVYRIRKGVIHLPTSVTVTKKDSWHRDSQRWETVNTDPEEFEGMQTVHIQRAEKIKTRTKDDNKTRSAW